MIIKDFEELESRIENISCHLNIDDLKKGCINGRAMLEETIRLKKCLEMLFKNGTIDIRLL